MRTARCAWALAAVASLGLAGCLVPATQLNEAQAENRALVSETRAQLAEIENLRAHSREIERRLVRAEEQLAVADDRANHDRTQLTNYERERSTVAAEMAGLSRGRPPLAPAVQEQLAALSKRYPSLKFDPVTGLSKLDTDILFDSGQSELKPGAKDMLRDLTRVLKSPAAAELKVMVVGHTDDRGVLRRSGRDSPANNFHISTARALAVTDTLRELGLAESRLGVAAFAAHEPVAPNATPQDRQKNRRVEIFVMTPGVPVVGWAETTPSVYR